MDLDLLDKLSNLSILSPSRKDSKEVRALRDIYDATYKKHQGTFQTNVTSNTTLLKKVKEFSTYILNNTPFKSVLNHKAIIATLAANTGWSIGATTLLENLKIKGKDSLITKDKTTSKLIKTITIDGLIDARDFTASITSEHIGSCFHYMFEEKLLGLVGEKSDITKIKSFNYQKPLQLLENYKTPKVITSIIDYLDEEGYEVVSIEFPVMLLALPVCKNSEAALRWLTGRPDFILYHPDEGVVLVDLKTGSDIPLYKNNLAQMYLMALCMTSMGLEVNNLKIIKIRKESISSTDIFHYKTQAYIYSIPYVESLLRYVLAENEQSKQIIETIGKVTVEKYLDTLSDVFNELKKNLLKKKKGRTDRPEQKNEQDQSTIQSNLRIYRLTPNLFVVVNLDTQEIHSIKEKHKSMDSIPIGGYKDIKISPQDYTLSENKQILITRAINISKLEL